MTIHKNILYTLVSAATLITSPAFSMQEEEREGGTPPIPVAQKPIEEDARSELAVLIGQQDYKKAFASIRETNTTSSDEDVVKFLLDSNGYKKYDTLSLENKRWIAELIAGKEVEISIPLVTAPPPTAAETPPSPKNSYCTII
ncbi:MAG: hypothetical protein JSR85_08650 [Proteobacteria bacterium]|nr:hypothetical protein [Pseudomonadota bacterium]